MAIGSGGRGVAGAAGDAPLSVTVSLSDNFSFLFTRAPAATGPEGAVRR